MTMPTTLPGAGVATDADQVERLRPAWAPDGAVDSDLDYFLAVVGRSPGVRPHVVHAPVEGGTAVAVARSGRHALSVAGRRVHLQAVVTSFGAVQDDDPRTMARLLEGLDEPVRSGRAAALVLQKVDTASRWYDHVRTSVPARRLHARPVVPLWQTDVSRSWEDLLSARSAKSRRQLRYDDSKVRRTFGNRMVLRRLDLPEHRHRLRAELDHVARASYQQRLGVSVVDDPLQSALLDEAAARGWLRVWSLSVDDAAVAFWWGIVRRGTLSIGSPGFVPEYAAHRVGYFTLRRLLEDACADDSIDSIDWGPGAAAYKERFGTTQREVRDLVVVRPGLPGAVLRTALAVHDAASVQARRTAHRHPEHPVVRVLARGRSGAAGGAR